MGLRYDELDEQGGIIEQETAGTGAGDGQVVGSSEVQWIWTGWEPRRAQLVLSISGPERGAHLRTLHIASHGDVPQQHTIVGDRTGGALDSPVVIETFDWNWPHQPDEIEVTIGFVELKPGIASLVTAPRPVLPDPDPEPQPADLLDDEDSTQIEEAEAALAAFESL